MSSSNQIVIEIFNAALKTGDPYESVKLHADKIRHFYQSGSFKRLIVVGFGKAASAMAKAIEDELPDLIDTGIVVTKYGHAENTEFGVRSSELGPKKLKKIKVIEAGHPVPDENGLNATEEIIKLLKNADENTLVVCLISGGGSALLAAPCEGISLEEKQKITQLLLKAGADINELNTVRKHISKVKGGRLAEIAYPARIISLILSDVIGDKLDVIASGPTSPDETTYNDALQVLKKYALMNKVPRSIIEILNKGVNNIIPETPKDDNPAFEKVENIIIGSSRKTLEAAKTKAESFGLQTEVISSKITGEAREVGRWLADKVKEFKSLKVEKFKNPLCLISGGETTVTVRGNGLGGRNMELALSFAIEIDGIDGITLLSAGTDGTDGPTDATGAIVDGQIVARAKAIGLDPETYLENNDSYNFFKQINELFITGPTGTNVMDIQIIVIE